MSLKWKSSDSNENNIDPNISLAQVKLWFKSKHFDQVEYNLRWSMIDQPTLLMNGMQIVNHSRWHSRVIMKWFKNFLHSFFTMWASMSPRQVQITTFSSQWSPWTSTSPDRFKHYRTIFSLNVCKKRMVSP